MIIPKWINKGDTIGVTATSDGVCKILDQKRFENARVRLVQLGYNINFTDNVFTADSKGRSSSGTRRGKEMNELFDDDQVRAIIAAKGGNYLVEMLAHVDFNKLLKNPKWFQGYSDNTGLVYTITTNYDIATIYGCNFGDFGMEPWQDSVYNSLAVLEGKQEVQESFARYQGGLTDKITGLEGYQMDQDVCWINARGEEDLEIKGRLLGGCLDVLLNLIGTKYDKTVEFAEKYKEDGILWYIESFDLDSEQLMMGLWQLKEAGWFKHANGFIFGRPCFYSTSTDTDYKEAVLERLGELELPIILEADIGHKGPQFSIINGIPAAVQSNGGSGKLVYDFKNLYGTVERY